MIEIALGYEHIERANRALAGIPGAAVRAIGATINKAIEGARTDATRAAKDIYHVKSSDIRRAIMVKRASPSKLEALMRAQGQRRSISEYKLTPRSPEKGIPDVQAAVKREGGMKDIPKAFIAKRGGSGYTAFIRDGVGRYGIRRLTSPAIPQLLGNPDVVREVEEKSVERVHKALDHEILRLLGAFE